ncbi:TetR/AcrR family transcriptional regulator [Arsenicicoccus dermatophilus]|uniref:TetR/AcrR family transcriptional regulator n=1 Tax=Arsenicicoccus dermatophilus TaxID=1076331 RepID=UPI001F4C874F|nr:TetR/AcrR family transcriptional regulator [Arsenicicoccus dermatophilus]MCH8611766.1 TetR/AcrR family transcriptional regulator [Arsenicicoccus dermatophilus]
MTSATPPPAEPGGAPRAATPVDGRSARWETHRRERRIALVDETIRAIRAHGAGVGLDDVAAQAGTSKTVLYRHFEDRAGLYRAVAERVASRIVDRVEESLSGDEAPQEVLRSVVDAYLSLVERDPELYRFVVRHPLVEGSLDEDPVRGISTQVADLVTGALAGSAPDPEVARTWAIALVGAVQASADAWLATDPGLCPSRAELTARLVSFAWNGASHRR